MHSIYIIMNLSQHETALGMVLRIHCIISELKTEKKCPDPARWRIAKGLEGLLHRGKWAGWDWLVDLASNAGQGLQFFEVTGIAHGNQIVAGRDGVIGAGVELDGSGPAPDGKDDDPQPLANVGFGEARAQ